MARAKTGILLALEPKGPGESDEDDWDDDDGEDPADDDLAHARPARDPQALIGGIESYLTELRSVIREME